MGDIFFVKISPTKRVPTSWERRRMIRIPLNYLRLIGFVLLVSLTVSTGADEPSKSASDVKKVTFSADQLAFYEKEVLPILKESCYKCHGNDKDKGNFSLMSRKTILEGGDLGPAVNLNKPETSNLIKAIHYKDGLEMPPKGKLSNEKIGVLEKWVKTGVPMPSPSGEVAKEKPKGGVVTPESKQYWAYKSVHRFPEPEVKNKSWVKNPIDAFILSKLEANQLHPAEPVDKVSLLRRAYYDLIGLPPTPEQIDAFVKDTSPKAFEKVVDHLLSLPQYGEKWGRHWLDVVRYAETNGYERDGPKPFAWRFRDYVIKSFNEDKPYDQFIKEQLAGDELPGEDPDAIIATGFYRLSLWDDEPADPKQARFDELDDWVGTTSQVFLGMTMNCARCHEHKIDPIPHADYYRLLAFFQDVRHYSNSRDVHSAANMTDITARTIRKTYEAELKKNEARIHQLTESMRKIEDEGIKKMPAEDQRASEGNDRPQVVKKIAGFLNPEQLKEYTALKKELDGLKKKPQPSRELALSVSNCLVRVPETHVQIRGSPHSPGQKVEPGFPKVLDFPDPKIPNLPQGAKTSGRRTVLANWIASKENQLTARVMVNRIWQHHFGRGIVPSSNDFGKFGETPTHPELLDWLASEFMNLNWKMKAFHKLIMLSNTYQMSSKAEENAIKIDPSNRLFWRFNMRRLTAEEVRDSFLAVSGKLNLKAGGPSIYPPLPREVLAGQSRPGEGWGNSSPEESSRRSVYVYMKRSLLVPILSQHDQADTDSSCPVRYTTTVPTQSLGMLNGEFSNEQAKFLAERLAKEAGNDLSSQVRRGIRLTSGRNPTEDEIKKDVAFIQELMTKQKLNQSTAMKQYSLMMLNTNEFIYLD
jgi:hypothetical protein